MHRFNNPFHREQAAIDLIDIHNALIQEGVLFAMIFPAAWPGDQPQTGSLIDKVTRSG